MMQLQFLLFLWLPKEDICMGEHWSIDVKLSHVIHFEVREFFSNAQIARWLLKIRDKSKVFKSTIMIDLEFRIDCYSISQHHIVN